MGNAQTTTRKGVAGVVGLFETGIEVGMYGK
jgi:hypothetical protein